LIVIKQRAAMKPPKTQFTSGADVRAHRRKLALNQQAFWSKLGVTQSGGSRYESGRTIPMPVQLLLHVAYAPEKASSNMVAFLRAPADSE
jgi:DNA-binding transcriptional regulator YiaG